MKPSAVLLIDLENFYCSREDYCRGGHAPLYDRSRFGHDLDKLLGFARSMTEDRATNAGLPFTVKRAYADFNASRYVGGAAPQHYLRQLPDELLSQGVEPVQVFRLSRGGNGRGSKNAADMRMAMDATALLATGGHVEHFVLVTGDADFIPVILELKRHGHTVSVIGVTGATSTKIQRFVDNFELFEDLLAAGEVEARGELSPASDGIGQIAGAVRRLLARNHPLRFAAIKPLLSKELGHPFDPGLFGCDTTGDFLRANQSALGIVIRQGQHDSEIDLPGVAVPSSNGTGGSRVNPRPAARPPEKPAEKVAVGPEPHTAAHYRHLLATPRAAAAEREGKVYAVPWPALVWACDAVVPLLTPPTGEPTHTTKLQPKLVGAADGASVPDLVKHVRMFYPTLRAGLPVQGTDGVYALPAEMTGERIRRSVLGYIAYVLRCRLGECSVAGDVRPDQLAAVFEPGPAREQATAEFATALADPAHEPAPELAPVPKRVPKPAPVADELHTPAGYLKLLKAGGDKGSETESYKVLPVPWPSVERVCADAYTLLCPGVGGGPLPREQLCARLTEAGKDLYVERYDQHVRRVLGIFRIAGDIAEADGLMSLNADVSSGHNLRGRALGFLIELLRLRLEEREEYTPIRPEVFVTALEAGPLTDRLLEDVVPAVAWLYRPAEEVTPLEPSAEPEPADATELSFKAFEPGTDSGAVVIDVELVPTYDGPGPEPTPVVAEPEAPVEPVPTAPGWDAFTFDGVLPEIDTGNDPIPPESRHEPTARVGTESAADLEAAPTGESPSGSLDVAVTTSEAVAAAAEDAPPAPDAEPFSQPIPEAEPESVAFAPTVSDPAPVDAPAAFAREVELAAAPVAEWMPEGDPLFADVEFAETPISLAPPTPPVRPTPPPLPLWPLGEEVAGEVARMKPPPLPRRLPPPLPPLPPAQPQRAEHDGPQVPPESA